MYWDNASVNYIQTDQDLLELSFDKYIGTMSWNTDDGIITQEILNTYYIDDIWAD
ncbi:MAG: hypothetical protein KAS32_24640 [Candidatus Peribacteraceae bacterium]|nr:hypothetical protein [Candidatus Peribacteraceae bacterium]